jgi:hypothetical protein
MTPIAKNNLIGPGPSQPHVTVKMQHRHSTKIQYSQQNYNQKITRKAAFRNFARQFLTHFHNDNNLLHTINTDIPKW